MFTVGLDVHSTRSTLCVLDEHGKQLRSVEVRGPREALLAAVRELPRPFRVCYEASCGYGRLHDQLKAIADCVVVAHPGQLRLIFRSKRKNDRVDSGKLAKLMYLNEVPAVHVPEINVRDWRRMIELRESLVRKRTAAKNQVRAVLRANAVSAPKKAGLAPKKAGLWTARGRAWLEAVELSSGDRLTVEVHLVEIDIAQKQIKRVEKQLGVIADKHPGVRLLMTIPGVGIRTAEAFIAYVDDPGRFARSKQFGCYFGLVPCQDASGGSNRLGHITRDGPSTVRKLLCEAAHVAVRKSPEIRERFERLMRGEPERKKIAIVAVAHYLCRVMGAMLKNGEVWRTDGKAWRKDGEVWRKDGEADRRRDERTS
jgi:transposase